MPEDMGTTATWPLLAPGTRVRIIGRWACLIPRSPLATVLGYEEGMVLIRMDHPADYHHADGRREPMTDVVIDADNLIVEAPDA